MTMSYKQGERMLRRYASGGSTVLTDIIGMGGSHGSGSGSSTTTGDTTTTTTDDDTTDKTDTSDTTTTKAPTITYGVPGIPNSGPSPTGLEHMLSAKDAPTASVTSSGGYAEGGSPSSIFDALLSRYYHSPSTDTQGFQPWPTLPSLDHPQQSFEVDHSRPQSWEERTGVSEGLSPTFAGYGMGQLGADTYLKAREGNYSGALANAPELAMALMPMRKGPHGEPLPKKTLEQYVGDLSSRPSVFDYGQYLSDPMAVVGATDRRLPSQEPGFARGKPSQAAKNLSHYQTLDRLRTLRDAGTMEGPEGNAVNPWYWPSPLVHEWTKEWGDDVGHQLLGRYLDYMGPTSIQTNVGRNAIEAWELYHRDLNDLPFNLTGVTLTGMGYPNKKAAAISIANGEGNLGTNAHKTRSYSQNLRGAGTAQPEYEFLPGGELERILTPVTLDSKMGETMRLRNKAGDPIETFRGPIYHEGVKVIHKLGEEVGAAGADTQAGIWMPHQESKRGEAVYGDSFARILDDVIHKVAAHYRMSPEDVKQGMISGRLRPPNIFPAAAGATAVPGMMLAQHYGDDSGE